MRVITSFQELAGIHEPIHWAMGVFDGVHLGHKLVISSARQSKDDMGGLVGVLTFDGHPMNVINPDASPRRIIADEREKLSLLKEFGVDVVLNLHFDKEMASLSARGFLDALEQNCPVGGISVGSDWRFGQGREGDTKMLEAEGRKRQFPVYVHPHLMWSGERISSTRIRKHIAHGDLDEVRAMLGRPYTITGEVVHGRRLGRQLGFPTANLRPANAQTPPHGVYLVKVNLLESAADDSAEKPMEEPPEEPVAGIANLGLRPTLTDDSHELLLEVHLFDFRGGDLYGKELRVEFVEFLRPEMKFDSLEELKIQIASDCESAKSALRRKKTEF